MLAVDIGNTFTRAALFKGRDIVERRSCRTRDIRSGELAALLSDLAPRAPSGQAWIASVVPSADAALDSAASRAGLERRFIRPGVDAVIPHCLKTPETAGVDRLLASLAAGERFFPGAGEGRGYVTIQCGSAVTVDHVDGSGMFRGGYILPGPAMWLGGLAAAAQLPDLSAETPDWDAAGMGDNTRDAMLHGMAAALPRAVAAAAGTAIGMHGCLGAAVTGGWGEAVLRHLPMRAAFDRDLVLHGIRLFAERRAASRR